MQLESVFFKEVDYLCKKAGRAGGGTGARSPVALR